MAQKIDNNNKYSIEELQKNLEEKSAQVINDMYKDNKLLSNSFKTDKELPNEIFEPYKEFDSRLEVSNLGRVKFDGKICEQTDEKTSIGYLYLKDYLEIKDKLNKSFDDEYVYEMVANVWLVKPKDFYKCQYDIHHIDNDGYNNSAQNLIWLKRCDHKKLHPFMKFPNTCKNCEIYKTWENK